MLTLTCFAAVSFWSFISFLGKFWKRKKRFSIWRNLPLKHSQDILFLGGSSPFILCVCQVLSHFQVFVTLWTVAHQAPLSMGLSGQEYWSGLPFPSLGDLPDSGIKSRSCIPNRVFMPEPSRKPSFCVVLYNLLCTFRENKFDIYIMLRDDACVCYQSSVSVTEQLWLQKFPLHAQPWKLSIHSIYLLAILRSTEIVESSSTGFLLDVTDLPFTFQVAQLMFRKANTDSGDKLTSKLTSAKLCNPRQDTSFLKTSVS